MLELVDFSVDGMNCKSKTIRNDLEPLVSLSLLLVAVRGRGLIRTELVPFRA